MTLSSSEARGGGTRTKAWPLLVRSTMTPPEVDSRILPLLLMPLTKRAPARPEDDRRRATKEARGEFIEERREPGSAVFLADAASMCSKFFLCEVALFLPSMPCA